MSTLSRLRADLREVEEGLVALVAISPVKWLNNNNGLFHIIGGADYYFADPNPGQLRLQVPLKVRYDRWFARFSLLCKNPPSDLKRGIEKAHSSLVKWIDLGGSNYEIGRDPSQNAMVCREAFKPFYGFLDLLEGRSETILIPDTNALIAAPDPLRYKSVAGAEEFTFLLLPTVLVELDNLKNFARDADFRDKVGRVVRRIKGWRKQGSLSEGVTLHRTIRVRAIAEEPDVSATLSWLDPSNRDDRIIASALEVQVLVPSAQVILVTGDINLQNKAEVARLPYEETP